MRRLARVDADGERMIESRNPLGVRPGPGGNSGPPGGKGIAVRRRRLNAAVPAESEA